MRRGGGPRGHTPTRPVVGPWTANYAQRVVRRRTTRLVDDLDGSPADTTVRYVWGGTTYEIDLSARNAQLFQAALAPYVAASRPVVAGAGSRRHEPRPRR